MRIHLRMGACLLADSCHSGCMHSEAGGCVGWKQDFSGLRHLGLLLNLLSGDEARGQVYVSRAGLTGGGGWTRRRNTDFDICRRSPKLPGFMYSVLRIPQFRHPISTSSIFDRSALQICRTRGQVHVE